MKKLTLLLLLALPAIAQESVDHTHAADIRPYPVRSVFTGYCKPTEHFTFDNGSGSYSNQEYVCGNFNNWQLVTTGGGGGSSAFTGLTDAATAALPTLNTPLANALGLKQNSGSPNANNELPLTFTGPLTRSTNTIAIAAASGSVNGYLTSADWSTFNAKQAALGYTPQNAANANSNNELPLTFSAPITRTGNTLSIAAATGSVNGYLTSADWTTFTAKVSATAANIAAALQAQTNCNISGNYYTPFSNTCATPGGGVTTNGISGQALTSNGAGGYGTPVTLGTAATTASTAYDASGAATAAQAASIAASAQRASNLSDLASAVTARTNLGLGSSATQNSSAFDASGAAASAQAASLQVASNLSDVAAPATARTNLGLGSAATQASTAFDAAGAATTAQAAAVASSLQKSANLSDVANAVTARTNLGLGTSATQAGTTGALVGTTDIQTITNKTVDGVVPATFAFLDPTSSIQTQLNGKQPTIAFTPENAANKGAVSGYAPLDAGSKVPTANIPTLNQSTTGNAATATQLAANGANCAAGNYPLGVDAFGAVEGCTPATGGGTVTAAPGALTSGAIMTGNGTTDSKTPSATTTLDASGNISTPGAVTSGAGGTGSGIFAFPGGTQATSITAAPTNSSGFVGPSPAPTGKHFLSNPATGAAANQFLLFGAEASSISTGAWSTYAQTISPVTNNFLTGFNAATGVFTQAAAAAVTGGVNAQTANYTLVSGDSNKLVTMTGTSLTASLPATPPSATWTAFIQNLSPTTSLIISRGTLLINGAASNFTLLPYQLIPFYTDGTNYFARPTYQAGTNTTLTTSPNSIQINATGGAATPGGSPTQLQYNSAGAFAGAPQFATDGTTITAGTSGVIDMGTNNAKFTNLPQAPVFAAVSTDEICAATGGTGSGACTAGAGVVVAGATETPFQRTLILPVNTPGASRGVYWTMGFNGVGTAGPSIQYRVKACLQANYTAATGACSAGGVVLWNSQATATLSNSSNFIIQGAYRFLFATTSLGTLNTLMLVQSGGITKGGNILAASQIQTSSVPMTTGTWVIYTTFQFGAATAGNWVSLDISLAEWLN